MEPSGIFGLFTSQVGQQQQQQYNREQRNEQNRLNLQQWSRENAYNTPSAQMARYADAGLNPNLIYGQQNTSAQSPMLTGGQPMDFAPFGQMSLQSMMLGAQIDNIKADTENKKVDTENKDANKNLLNEQSKLVAQEVRKLTEENNFYFNPIVRQQVITAFAEDGKEFQEVKEYVSSNFAKKFDKEFNILEADFETKQSYLVVARVESWIKEEMYRYLSDPENSQTLPEYFEALYNSPRLQNEDTQASKVMKLAAAALSGNESLLVQAQTELTKVTKDIQKLTKETLEVIPPEVRGALLIAQGVLSSMTEVANSVSNFVPKTKKIKK